MGDVGSARYEPALLPPWSGMGEVVPARTSLTLHPPSHCAVIILFKRCLNAQNVEIWRRNVKCHDLTFCVQRVMLRVTADVNAPLSENL